MTNSAHEVSGAKNSSDPSAIQIPRYSGTICGSMFCVKLGHFDSIAILLLGALPQQLLRPLTPPLFSARILFFQNIPGKCFRWLSCLVFSCCTFGNTVAKVRCGYSVGPCVCVRACLRVYVQAPYLVNSFRVDDKKGVHPPKPLTKRGDTAFRRPRGFRCTCGRWRQYQPPSRMYVRPRYTILHIFTIKRPVVQALSSPKAKRTYG